MNNKRRNDRNRVQTVVHPHPLIFVSVFQPQVVGQGSHGDGQLADLLQLYWPLVGSNDEGIHPPICRLESRNVGLQLGVTTDSDRKFVFIWVYLTIFLGFCFSLLLLIIGNWKRHLREQVDKRLQKTDPQILQILWGLHLLRVGKKDIFL